MCYVGTKPTGSQEEVRALRRAVDQTHAQGRALMGGFRYCLTFGVGHPSPGQHPVGLRDIYGRQIQAEGSLGACGEFASCSGL